jgi:cupin domain
VSIVEGYTLEPMTGDPDDHRPGTRWLPMADPGDDAGRVDDLVAIVERIGVGERIPLHVHRSSEVIFVHGPGRARLGDTERDVEDGAVVFIPAGVAHGLLNRGDSSLALEAVFPTASIWIHYLERNPAPGAESAPIAQPMTIDVRTGEVTFDPE